MGSGLWWSFGEPHEERGELVADFYYQIGRHVELRLPWPTRRFADAGGLSIQIGEKKHGTGWPHDITAKTEETGRRLYDLLGKEAQASLIRTFANQNGDSNHRTLYLLFPTPSAKNREICLTLEDLPWELLHDGEEFISWRYSIQIVRAHPRETFPVQPRTIGIASWGILLVTPFVFSSEDQYRQVGLEPLPLGAEEVKTIRSLQQETHGLVLAGPLSRRRRSPWGITTFHELEEHLLGENVGRYHLIHFVGHGVIYDDEPCLCFESDQGGIDYVSVNRLRKLFTAIRDSSRHDALPAVLFLNACSSSSRGRYSSGFASGLHDLGMCVLGYHSDIYDDDKPLLAAESFYRSICIDQSLQNPQQNPNVLTAIGAARRRLRDQGGAAKPAWGNLRAYVPSEISFEVRGRGFIERTLQKVYSHFASWMNPLDYTDHLSIGFQFAVLFGALMGLINLIFIFPETLLVGHYTYQEIVSEILRIFLIGPLSFLAAAIFISIQTMQNHRFLRHRTGKIPILTLLAKLFCTLPVLILAGVAFGLLFNFSFSRLDLLTSQITIFSSLTKIPIEDFWIGFLGIMGGAITISLLLASGFCLKRKETLHSYRTFYWVFVLYSGIAAVFIIDAFFSEKMGVYRTGCWTFFVLLNIFAYSSVSTKTLKEITWRAMQKNAPPPQLSWRKLIPLLGGALLVVFCYFLLEESVRFEQSTIQNAIIKRKESILTGEFEPHVEKILERALRQRAIHEIPGSIMENESVAKRDWLLSLVCADYILFRSQQREEKSDLLEDISKSQGFLTTCETINGEVKFKDYYCNIVAMVEFLHAENSESEESKPTEYQQALTNGIIAVDKDNRNFAYLDTLARVEAKIGDRNNDLELLKRAAVNIRQARWRAFFLRSPMASEVRRSIDEMAKSIQKQIKRMEDDYKQIPTRVFP